MGVTDFVLTLEWECQQCGWKIIIDAPGFAGDGYYHWSSRGAPGGGERRCGPLVARRFARSEPFAAFSGSTDEAIA